MNCHLLLELKTPTAWGDLGQYENDSLRYSNRLLNVLLHCLDLAGAHIRGVLPHTFSPIGSSAVVLLAESHAAIHYWPEDRRVLVDYFSCAEDPGFDAFQTGWALAGFLRLDCQIIPRNFTE